MYVLNMSWSIIQTELNSWNEKQGGWTCLHQIQVVMKIACFYFKPLFGISGVALLTTNFPIITRRKNHPIFVVLVCIWVYYIFITCFHRRTIVLEITRQNSNKIRSFDFFIFHATKRYLLLNLLSPDGSKPGFSLYRWLLQPILRKND